MARKTQASATETTLPPPEGEWTWVRASYHTHVFHYRMPETVAIAAVSPLVPSPLTVKMALVAALARTGNIAGARELIAFLPHLQEFYLIPPEGAVTFKAFMRYVRPPADPTDQDKNTGGYYAVSPHLREYTLWQDELGVLLRCPVAMVALMTRALWDVVYLGAKDSQVTCTNVRTVSECSEVDLQQCVRLVEPKRLGREKGPIFRLADLVTGSTLSLDKLIPFSRRKADYRDGFTYYLVNCRVQGARKSTAGRMPMPYALVLPLQRTNNAPLPEAASECTHAAFFDLLARVDPRIAAWLHAVPERKPFTLGMVREDNPGRPRAGDTAFLRVSFLEDELFPFLAEALIQGGLSEGLRIGEAHFVLVQLLATSEAHPRAGYASYLDIWEQARPTEILTVRFGTPTVFRSQGRDVLWPEPRLVWQSWIRAWNVYGEEAGAPPLDEAYLIEQVETRVTVEKYQLETERLALSAGAVVGFTGPCAFGLRRLDADDRHVLAVLADFAFFAGTGRKTTMGMGQTGRI